MLTRRAAASAKQTRRARSRRKRSLSPVKTQRRRSRSRSQPAPPKTIQEEIANGIPGFPGVLIGLVEEYTRTSPGEIREKAQAVFDSAQLAYLACSVSGNTKLWDVMCNSKDLLMHATVADYISSLCILPQIAIEYIQTKALYIDSKKNYTYAKLNSVCFWIQKSSFSVWSDQWTLIGEGCTLSEQVQNCLDKVAKYDGLDVEFLQTTFNKQVSPETWKKLIGLNIRPGVIITFCVLMSPRFLNNLSLFPLLSQ